MYIGSYPDSSATGKIYACLIVKGTEVQTG